MVECIVLHRLKNDLGRFDITVLCLLCRNAEKGKFKRDSAPANAEIESTAAESVEHTNLLECSQGMVQIQQHHQRP